VILLLPYRCLSFPQRTYRTVRMFYRESNHRSTSCSLVVCVTESSDSVDTCCHGQDSQARRHSTSSREIGLSLFCGTASFIGFTIIKQLAARRAKVFRGATEVATHGALYNGVRFRFRASHVVIVFLQITAPLFSPRTSTPRQPRLIVVPKNSNRESFTSSGSKPLIRFHSSSGIE
jgi:hypothetical protein